jgi:hypothetical protein
MSVVTIVAVVGIVAYVIGRQLLGEPLRGKRLATGSAAILLTLGVSRVVQAVVAAPRALAAGIPFAPEKDGSSVLSGAFGSNIEAPSASPPWDMSQRQESLPASLSSRFIDHTTNRRSTAQVVVSNRSADALSRQDWRLLLRQIVDRLDGHTR